MTASDAGTAPWTGRLTGRGSGVSALVATAIVVADMCVFLLLAGKKRYVPDAAHVAPPTDQAGAQKSYTIVITVGAERHAPSQTDPNTECEV